MIISDEKLDRFIMLYRDRFGKDISRTEAYNKGIKLITLIKLCCVTNQNNQKENKYKNIQA